MPVAREHAEVYSHPVVDRHILLGLSSKILKDMYRQSHDFKRKEKTLGWTLKMADTFWPATQTTANLNINTDANIAKEIVDKILGDDH